MPCRLEQVHLLATRLESKVDAVADSQAALNLSGLGHGLDFLDGLQDTLQQDVLELGGIEQSVKLDAIDQNDLLCIESDGLEQDGLELDDVKVEQGGLELDDVKVEQDGLKLDDVKVEQDGLELDDVKVEQDGLKLEPSTKVKSLDIGMEMIQFDDATRLSIDESFKICDPTVSIHRERKHCLVCDKYTMSSYFVMNTDPDTLICNECFIHGKIPHEYSSSDFFYLPGAQLLAVEHDEWKMEETLKMLEMLEENKPWEDISDTIKKSIVQCQYKFLTLPSDHIQGNAIFQDLWSRAENPILYMIQLLSAAGHPILGAEAARVCLNVLSKEPMPNVIQSKMQAICQLGFDAAVNLSQQIVDQEEKNIESLVKQAIKAQQQRIKLKLDILDSLQSPKMQYDYEKAKLARLWSARLL